MEPLEFLVEPAPARARRWEPNASKWGFKSPMVGLLTIISSLICSSCGDDQVFRESKLLMGTVVQITVAGRSEQQARAAMDAAFAEIERVDGLVSSYREESLIARLNREGHQRKIPLEKDIFDLFLEAVAVGEQSEGAFDITIWPVAKLWGFEKGGVLPDNESIAEAVDKVGYLGLVLDKENHTVGLSREGMGVDLGAIAKGWAVDRAMEKLAARGIGNAIIDAGGDLRIAGSRPGKGSWRIGVLHPREPGALLLTFDLSDTAIVTSGDYERFFVDGGVRYHHILDPATGKPAAGCQSVTVLAATTAEADAAATAAFVLGPERGISFLRSRPGVRGLIVDGGGALHWTDETLERMARR